MNTYRCICCSASIIPDKREFQMYSLDPGCDFCSMTCATWYAHNIVSGARQAGISESEIKSASLPMVRAIPFKGD